MKNSTRPLFLLHKTLYLALCILAGSILLASAKPRFVRWTARWWSVIHHSRERISTTLGIAHGDLRMVCVAARLWKPTSWCSRWTVLVLTLLLEAVLNSVVSVATEDRLFFTCFSTQWSCSVSLCGLAVVAPRRFHFTISALSIDRGSSSRAEVWQTDLLKRWQSMTVPR